MSVLPIIYTAMKCLPGLGSIAVVTLKEWRLRSDFYKLHLQINNSDGTSSTHRYGSKEFINSMHLLPHAQEIWDIIGPILKQGNFQQKDVFYMSRKPKGWGLRHIIRNTDILSNNPGPFAANIIGKPTRMIFCSTSFFKADYMATRFALKHEASHVLNADTWRPGIVSIVATVAITLLSIFFLPLSLAGVWLTFTAAAIINLSIQFIIGSVAFETKADSLAIKHSTNEELLGGLRLFIALQQLFQKINASERLSKTPNRSLQILTSIEGDALEHYMTHGALKNRISRVSDEILRRKIRFDPQEELSKITPLRTALKESLIQDPTIDVPIEPEDLQAPAKLTCPIPIFPLQNNPEKKKSEQDEESDDLKKFECNIQETSREFYNQLLARINQKPIPRSSPAPLSAQYSTLLAANLSGGS